MKAKARKASPVVKKRVVQLLQTDAALIASQLDPVAAFLAVETRRVCARMVAAEALGVYNPPIRMCMDINATIKTHSNWTCVGQQRCGEYGRGTAYERKEIE